MKVNKSPLAQANEAFRSKDYNNALRLYIAAQKLYPELKTIIDKNIENTRKHIGLSAPKHLETSNTTTIDIVVPVYNALDDVKKCFASLSESTDSFKVNIIVVNDGSDEQTTLWLREYCKNKPLFTLIENPKNLGYTKTVNVGLKASTADYVITQNSDTIVSKGWLVGLVNCINSDPKIGICGPLSNAATWQNVPNLYDDSGKHAVNELPQGLTVSQMAEIVSKASLKLYPRLPFVNGFCFMIKREVLNKVGYMDEENFPIGYGEENDYCIRAQDAGYELAIADNVYVYHAKSKSFGHEKRKELSDKGILNLKRKHTAEKYTGLLNATKVVADMNAVRNVIRRALEQVTDANLEKGVKTVALDQGVIKDNHPIEIIIAEKESQQPDFFNLKSRDPNVDLLVVAWVSEISELARLIKEFPTVPQSFDLLIMLPRNLADDHKIPVVLKSCNSITIIGFPRVTQKSGAFVRVNDTGLFAKYLNLLWIENTSIKKYNDIQLPNLSQNTSSYNIGLLAHSLVSIDEVQSPYYKKYIGTWFARLHKKPPAFLNKIPAGSFFIKSVVLRNFSGMTLNPAKFDSLSIQSDTEAFGCIRMAIGTFADEGMYDVLEFTNLTNTAHSDNVSRTVKTIAFFLPQFHIIPENDKWWGRGFTEWNNVVRAKPLFRSHYQPHLPADLGFYDLRSQTTQIKQAELAEKFGVHGFCYYYYWFNGVKLLNEPIEQMLATGKPDFPFCVCWANENWSRNWDGQNRHVLMEQKYSKESNLELIREFILMMKDPRYIRHHGKPVLLVYRIKIIPNWLETAQIWREECRKAGIGEIHLCSIRFGLEPLEGMPEQHGLDSYVLFPPQDMNFVNVKDSVHDLHPNFGGTIFSYDEVVKGDVDRFRTGYPWPVHRGAMLGWDNTARRLTAARIFTGCTPMRYRGWLKQIVQQENQHNKDSESLLFINAWNEWAEGTTLEPDQRFGTAYLEATHSVIEPYLEKGKVHNEGSHEPGLKKSDVKKLSSQAAMPKLPEWHQGKVEYNSNFPTVLLCAHISGHQLFGGERSFLDVLSALQKLGLNIVVTLPSGNNKNYINHILTKSLGVYTFSYPQWTAAREPDPMLTLQFSDIIATHNISIVYSNTIVLIEPAIAAKQMNRLSVVHARELITIDDALRERIGLPVQTIIKTVFERYDFIIGNSRATERIFAREDRTYYVPNAVDANELAVENKIGSRVKIGIVSSNIPKKGITDFIEVAKLCQDIAQISEFVVIGPDNPQVEIWKKDIAAGQLPGNLKFLGYRDTPKEAMAELNVLLNLSSFAESFGRTVAEAMAAHRPVIAYEWGALPELVQHGKTGFMAPFGDTAKIASYLRQLCLDKSSIQQMGETGFKFVTEKFSQEALFQHLKVAMDAIQCSSYWNKLSENELRLRACNQVTIIIPVYNAADEVKNCIESVLKLTPLHHASILIINDGSTELRISKILKEYEGKSGIRIIHNDTNIGYTKTVNRGIKEAGRSDVILLNSDTIVTPAWLSGMRASAYAEPKIGTVTAMSDNAGAFSFPIQGEANLKPNHLTHDEYAMRIIQQTINCKFPEVPTGSGFCMYIRRDLMDEIGVFDEILFPRGYGEENDFCMRALNKGWKNVITSWAFVYHVRTASFKGEKDKLVKAGVDAVTRRYPDYASSVKAAFAAPLMQTLREVAKLKL